VLRVRVGGTAKIDGRVVSDGANGILWWDGYTDGQGTGGGAGGSVWLTTATLTGSGVIGASGGAGTLDPKLVAFGGGGGGGRVRIDHHDRAGWRGKAIALGGAGARAS